MSSFYRSHAFKKISKKFPKNFRSKKIFRTKKIFSIFEFVILIAPLSTHGSKTLPTANAKGGFSGFPEKPFSSQEEKNKKNSLVLTVVFRFKIDFEISTNR